MRILEGRKTRSETVALSFWQDLALAYSSKHTFSWPFLFTLAKGHNCVPYPSNKLMDSEEHHGKETGFGGDPAFILDGTG